MFPSTRKRPLQFITIMSDRSAWNRKLPGKIYDYNYQVSEGYYKPQTDYIANKSLNREKLEPPKHQSYAERFAYKPWYGGVKGLPYDEKISALSEPLLKPSERNRCSSLVREIKELEEDNIPLHIRASRRRKKFEEEERQRGVRPKVGRTTSLTEAPINKLNNIRREIEQINDDMCRSSDMPITKSSFSHNNSFGKSSYSSSTSSTFNRNESKYSLPRSNSAYNRSYNTNSISSYSSKPPAFPSPKVSNGLSSPKFIESVFRPWPVRRASFSGETIPSASFNRADKFRQVKRAQESKEAASSINSMVDKMRVGKLDENAAFSFASNLQSSSLEPPSRRGSRKGRVIYGIAK